MNFRIMEEFERLGIEFAFPSKTLPSGQRQPSANYQRTRCVNCQVDRVSTRLTLSPVVTHGLHSRRSVPQSHCVTFTHFANHGSTPPAIVSTRKKPDISVIVVRIGPEASAGS